MSVGLSIFLAVIVTTAVSLISIPILLLVIMVTVGWLSAIFKGFWFATFMQLIGYTAADLSGIILGSLLLRRADALSYLPILFVPVAIGSILYMKKRFPFATEQAERLNKRQKAANLLGTVFACVLALVLTQNW